MSQWVAQDTKLSVHHPEIAASTFGSFRELMAPLYLEARMSPRTVGRWLVYPPTGASVSELSELRNLGLRVENRGWTPHGDRPAADDVEGHG